MENLPHIPSEITQALEAWNQNEPDALDHLLSMVFEEIRFLARRALAKDSNRNTLQTTELVSEVYLRLVGIRKTQWENRQQFFGFLADLMRRILIDRARRHLAAKRGGGAETVSLDLLPHLTNKAPRELLEIDDALKALAKVNERQYLIIKLSYFVGLTHEEIADVLGLGLRTIDRDLTYARAFLSRLLKKP